MISFREKNYMYSYNKMQPKPFSTHLHKYYEILYFVQGDATYVVEGVEYKAEDGDLFITRPGEVHSIVFKSDRKYERYFIQISEEYFQGIEVDLLYPLRHKPLGENNKIPKGTIPREKLDAFFIGVGDYVVNRRAESEILIKTYIIQLLAEINHALENRKTGGEIKENERISAAKEFINNNLCKNLTLEKIAEGAYTDKFYLSHLFKKETGLAIKDYITMQRIALAKRLVAENGSPSKVYSECGFNDYSSFYRAVKRLTGKSPAEFFNK